MKKLLFIVMAFCMVMLVSCSKKSDEPSSPNNGGSGILDYDIAYSVRNITSTSVDYYVRVTVPDTNKLEEIGTCWGANAHPTISTGTYLTSDEGTTTTFTVENLTPGTHYYIRGFLKYESDYYYGPDSGFTTLEE